LVLNTIQAIPALAGRPFPYLDETWVGSARVEINLLNGDFYAKALYAQDVDHSSTAQMRYRPAGGAWTEFQSMSRVPAVANAAYVNTVSSLGPGSYQFEFEFRDEKDGVTQGASSQTTQAAWTVVYLPAVLKASTP
jgi:hypothetical protein